MPEHAAVAEEVTAVAEGFLKDSPQMRRDIVDAVLAEATRQEGATSSSSARWVGSNDADSVEDDLEEEDRSNGDCNYYDAACEICSAFSSDFGPIPGDSVVQSGVQSEVDDPDVAGVHLSKEPTQPQHGRSWNRNTDPERGNFGLHFGNWGIRGKGRDNVTRTRTRISDRQLSKSPAQVVVVVEATLEVEELLKHPPKEAPRRIADAPQSRLDERESHKHWVVRGNESSSVLIAARQDTCHSLDMLEWDLHNDFKYNQDKRKLTARTRTLVCSVGFKQNIGHLGTDIVIAGTHLHFKTAKMEKKEQWNGYWNRLAQAILRFNVAFLAGDFNMSLTEVPKELRSRGIKCDCVAWYPWQRRGPQAKGEIQSEQKLGIDSCAIFYIGGNVTARLQWGFDGIPKLAAVADGEETPRGLDSYRGSNVPGQSWTCYRSIKHQETPKDKDLIKRLETLLEPSTTQASLRELERSDQRNSECCPYLRLVEKRLDISEWLVGDEIHNGAHFPLCVFTENARARSEEAIQRRAIKKQMRMRQWKEKGAAVAGDSAGKGKGNGSKGNCGSGKTEAQRKLWNWHVWHEQQRPPMHVGTPKGKGKGSSGKGGKSYYPENWQTWQ